MLAFFDLRTSGNLGQGMKHDLYKLVGPHLKYAMVPLAAVLGLMAGIATTLQTPAETCPANQVVAMKPIEGSDAQVGFAATPIEVLYGVPTERTIHLWPKAGK